MKDPRVPLRLARILATTFVVLSAPSAFAADWLLATHEPRVVPGEVFTVTVVGDGTGPLPDTLAAVVELPGNAPRIAVPLVASAAEAGGRRAYAARWPREVTGMAVLALQDAAAARLIIDASLANEAQSQLAAQSAAPAGEFMRQPASAEPVESAPLGFHEPMYFLVGGNPNTARFQFSFRYRLFDSHGVVGETFPVVRGLYFGFTQTSMWDLAADSKPFHDTSFRPSLFYQWRVSNPLDGNSVNLQGGYEHESNGKDGLESRSIDTLFLRADARYYFADGRTYLGVAPKVWTYLDKDDNPDITGYRGYGELGLRFGRDDGLLLNAQLRRGTKGKGSTQLDLSYPIRLSIFSGVGAFAHLQYFNGYGETLLDYNEPKTGQFRIGVSIVR
ncbi:phospholipase A [Azoarcus indigens]|uniref:Phospholipase A1 n=1 Tax=Azoarcus indigens TaxID=29545 RepID=A0A4R6E7G3_9RHOO|nr:phospholipase A [Azoarcus indigens]TDN53886.1 phospholipase A1-like protein [Azoarcus indigens]